MLALNVKLVYFQRSALLNDRSYLGKKEIHYGIQ